MQMVPMEMSAAEAKEQYGASPTTADAGNAPKYPYGLCLELDDETLAKLGVTALPEVGTVMLVQAHVIVTSVGMSQQQDGDKEQRASLQITEMALGAPNTDEARAEKLYK